MKRNQRVDFLSVFLFRNSSELLTHAGLRKREKKKVILKGHWATSLWSSGATEGWQRHFYGHNQYPVGEASCRLHLKVIVTSDLYAVLVPAAHPSYGQLTATSLTMLQSANIIYWFHWLLSASARVSGSLSLLPSIPAMDFFVLFLLSGPWFVSSGEQSPWKPRRESGLPDGAADNRTLPFFHPLCHVKGILF